MNRPQQHEKEPAILKTSHIIGIVASAVGCVIILVWGTYCIIRRRRRKSSPARKKVTHVLAPWLSSSSPVYISRPIPAQSEEKLCSTSPSQDEVYVQPVVYRQQGSNTTLDVLNSTEPEQSMPKDDQRIPAPILSPSPLALLDRPLPAHRQHALRPHTISISAGNRRLRVDKRVTIQALTSKPLVRGKTIVIHDDTKTRPSSTYSNDDYRVSVYPSTPSDPGASFSRHITPVASRHASFMMPRWQNERVPELPEGY